MLTIKAKEKLEKASISIALPPEALQILLDLEACYGRRKSEIVAQILVFELDLLNKNDKEFAAWRKNPQPVAPKKKAETAVMAEAKK